MNDEADELDEPDYDGDNVQMNVDEQSYGEQSITEDSENVNKDCDQEITKAVKSHIQTDSMMKESSNESDQSTTNQNVIARQKTRQQTQSDRSLATRTRRQSQTHMISLGYLNDTG